MTNASSDDDVDIETLYARVSGTTLRDVLGFQNTPRPETLLGRIDQLRRRIARFSADPDDADLVAAMMARLDNVERLVLDPLEVHVHLRADALRQDPADPAARAMFEGEFYEAHLVRALWLQNVTWGAADPKRQTRFPVLGDAVVVVAGNGAPIPVGIEALTKHGVRLVGMPLQGFQSGTIDLQLRFPEVPAPLAVQGTITSRKGDRANITFVPLAPDAVAAIEQAIRRYVQPLQHMADRFAIVAPDDATARVCKQLAQAVLTDDNNVRLELLEAATQAATASPNNVELQLAVARLALMVGNGLRAQGAVRRARELKPDDSRVADLDAILSRPADNSLRARFAAIRMRAAGGVKSARLVASAIVAVVAVAGGVAYFTWPGRLNNVVAPADGLQCLKTMAKNDVAICVMPANTVIPSGDDAFNRRVAATRAALRVKTIIVYGEDNKLLATLTP